MSENMVTLLTEKRTHEIRSVIDELNAVDIAALFEELDAENDVLLFRLLPKELAATVFSYLPIEQQEDIVNSLSDPELSRIVNDLYTDDAVDFLEEMPASVVKRVLNAANEETRKQINHLLQYPENSAGSVMTTEFVGLKRNMTVADTFAYIRRNGKDKETIYTCYVTDQTRVLVGYVTVRKLLLCDEAQTIGDIMEEHTIFATTNEDREDVAIKVRKYGLTAIPVVDNEGRLVGIITVDDIMDVAEQENTEDFQLMAAVAPSEEPYLKTGVLEHARRRTPWLLLLMISGTFTGLIISSYEAAFTAVPILVNAIPMLMDTGGNAGSQSSTLIIRGIALGELSLKNWATTVWKELRISALVGAGLAIVNIVRIYIIDKNMPFAITVGITLWATVIFAKTIGCTLPLLAKKVKLDPAIMASPLITTIVDAISLTIYFSIATMLMGL